MSHSYIETPTTHHIAPRATVEQVEPANPEIAAMFLEEAMRGWAPWVVVTDFDGEIEVVRACNVKIGRKR